MTKAFLERTTRLQLATLTLARHASGAPPGEFRPDDCVRVEGQAYPLGREVIIDAARVTGIESPGIPT